jgi:sugar phosphate isomerase/epimerase
LEKSIYRFMKVGLIHFMAYPSTMKGDGPIIDTVKKIAIDEYFQAIEITWIKDEKIRMQVKSMLDASHMTVVYGGQPSLLTTGLNINDINEEGRVKAVNLLKQGIDEAYEINAVGFAYLSGKYDKNRKEDAYRALIKSTQELCAYARSRGNLKIALEVFDFDIDKKSLIGPAELAARFAREIRAEFGNFGLLVDLSHIPLLHESIQQSLLPIKDYIIHAHMGNCVVKDAGLPAYGDAHPRFGFPGGENDIDELSEYLRFLLSIGFLNEHNPPVVSFEVKPFGNEDPDIIIANAKRVLNLAWLKV